MTLPYKRSFNAGRQSEQFLNDQLHQIHTALENINYRKNENKGAEPKSVLDGALWFDKIDNKLKYWDEPSKSWKCVFSHLFQITSEIANYITPGSPVIGQLWIDPSGVLMYFDGLNWKPIKSIILDDSQWSNAAFSDYQIVTPLNSASEGEAVTHLNTNFILSTDEKWNFDKEYDVENLPEDKVVPETEAAQFVVPNINTDRLFINEKFDDDYKEINTCCVQYMARDVYGKILSAIHMNPGKLTKITKRLIRIDRLNPTIEMSAYNTEFYGFRADFTGGGFLIPSEDQDHGDYVAAGDHIILNYNATQNYDYVLAITFEFTWIKSDGLLDKHSGKEDTTSFYIANLKTPVAVHADGFILEDPVVDVDAEYNTVTIKENAEDLDVDIWFPQHKEFGYIREIDLEGNGIIHLHSKPEIPIVFVGGVLMHPVFSGMEIDLEKGIIIVPNESPIIENMKNQPWCVVDIKGMTNEAGIPFMGTSQATEGVSVIFDAKHPFNVQSNEIVVDGELGTTDESGIYDFILAAGTFKKTGFVDILYDPARITENDGVLLFVNGLLVCPDDIDRDDNNGIINIDNLEEDAEFVLLKDPYGCIYKHADIMQAYSIGGLLSESLVYYDGRLLANENCVATTDNENTIILNGATHNEIKLFIEDEYRDIKTWKSYDSYTMQWIPLNAHEIEDVEKITGAYINLLTTVKVNLDGYDKDKLDIFAFRFANSNSGIYKGGEAVWLEEDENDGLPIYKTGSDPFAHGMNNLNIFRNGIKLISGIDYTELADSNKVKILTNVDIDRDIIKYLIEPIEKGENKAYEQHVLTKAIQPNVYKLEETEEDLYPGRIVVFVNGLRISERDFTVLDNHRIMLNFSDYKAVSEKAGNLSSESFIKDDSNIFEVSHHGPDYIVVEVRRDYDRKEVTFSYNQSDGHQLFVADKKIPEDILDCKDEILWYVNGQYVGISRRTARDYNINKYKGCIEILDDGLRKVLQTDPMKALLNDPTIKSAWEKRNGAAEYKTEAEPKITLVWR